MDYSDSVNCCLSPTEVLEIIAPVDPDQLYVIDQWRGIWEAFWGHRNEVDLQRLKRHPRIELIDHATFREGMPESMVLRFQVIGA